MPTEPGGLAIPLAGWADHQLRVLAAETGSDRIAELDGATLLGERGSNGAFTINGLRSAGIGGSRLMPTRDGGWFALTLLRAEDRALLPALFGEELDTWNDGTIAAAVAQRDVAELVARGRLLGLPVASADETPASPPLETIAEGPAGHRGSGAPPLVIDLSAIWAGPLAGHLLWLAGAEVIKVESLTRPDLIRRDDPATFDLINQGKASVVLDFASTAHKTALVALIRRADIVIESSRPRALRHLGIDAEALVRTTPGLVWLSITGHGARGDAADWAGIGNDCGVAAGLSRALEAASGTIGYVGDAIPDPLTGITAALAGWRAFRAGTARRIGFAMSAIAAHALADERLRDPAGLEADLRAWGQAVGRPFPKLPRRAMIAEARPPARRRHRAHLSGTGAMLIANAEVQGRGRADVRIADGLVTAVGELTAQAGEAVIDARGGALLPGLHDHHIHLFALAAKASSIVCGPPAVETRAQLAQALAEPGEGWLRGVGYHESVMGLPDATALDALVHDRPLRMQHRSGRMWLLNSAALEIVAAHLPHPAGLERIDGRLTGRLFEGDEWLRAATGGTPPDLSAISRRLAAFGVTGVTDMSPRNDAGTAALLAAQIDAGALLQRLVLAGTLGLGEATPDRWTLGPAKLHLHEAELPVIEPTLDFIRQAHGTGRAVAIHCVSEVELVFALALFEAAGAIPGDRIEHASVTSPELADRIAALGLQVCVQPHFIAERGDRYLADVEPRHHADLYRLRTFAARGVVMAGGSDAPFGDPDPWAAMRAAVSRQTQAGTAIGTDEALSPDEALDLFLRDPLDLARTRRIEPGVPADLCLLDRPWAQARGRLVASDVRGCWISGQRVYQRIDEPPCERLPSAQALAREDQQRGPLPPDPPDE